MLGLNFAIRITNQLKNFSMLRHAITIAYRNALKHLNYTIINVLGLALGISSFIFIAIYVSDEMKYDKFHENADQIYRMNRLYNSNDINEDACTCSFPLAPAIQTDYPDMVKNTVRFFDLQRGKILFENRENPDQIIKFNEEWFYMADSTVFDVFTFPFVAGDPETALDRPNTMVITESTAKRYFGDEPALGKSLWAEEQAPVEITGVIKDLPDQSHFNIDILVSMATFREIVGGTLPQTWIWNPCWTYIQLNDNVSPESLEANLDQFYLNHYPDFQNQDVKLYLQPLTDIHLHSNHEYEMHPNGSMLYVKILSAIAIFVLILACVNFMNLATASSAGRAGEVGLKKVYGAGRSNLTFQFMGEAIFYTFLAFIISVITVEILLNTFNNFTGKNIPQGIFLNPANILIGLGLVLVVGFFSGSYPAFFMSKLDSKRLKESFSKGAKAGLARKGLVVFQFSISIALIIATFTIFYQLKFMRNAELGFDQKGVIIVPTTFQIIQQYDAFTNELKQHSEINYVTGMEDVLGVNHNTRPFVVEGLDPNTAYYFPAFIVRYDFVETFGIDVVAGRSFSTDFPSDTLTGIMINETMVKNMGWTNENAIGKKVVSDGDERVIGVFKDFNALSLRKPIGNFLLDMMPPRRGGGGLTRYLAIKVNSDNYPELIKFIQSKWEEFAPSRPFEYFFLEDKLDQQYRDETKFSKISLILTLLAIIIASLGLVGLTSFLIERKTKEISIRKVHGAPLSAINRLLNKEFMSLILLAFLISWPVAFYGTKDWLESFSKHIPIQWQLFILSGVITLILAFLIIIVHAIRAYSINPADTLKYE
jgi:putative ABC transport system permease protein